VHLIKNEENYGFAKAVNQGIEFCKHDYVILLNNDTVADEHFVEMLYKAASERADVFAYQARMLKLYDKERIDSCGDLYCALGWAFALGKDKDLSRYTQDKRVFSACAGAAIYNRKLLLETGLFDERHGSYLEDVDICYRARILGYISRYTPDAVVYHAGSGVTGSRHNPVKVSLSSRNSVYLIYKNMPLFQLIINIPFIILGYLIKLLFFAMKGMGAEYYKGVIGGIKLCASGRKYPFKLKNLRNYVLIQFDLWINMIRRITG
ncbi:MAG: glycosyltransferase family 2 protein, partial [Lachnospiraceae bacterium]|nr:glycosyltransferase family 2 protein [Lachnospiraceae bacterium]